VHDDERKICNEARSQVGFRYQVRATEREDLCTPRAYRHFLPTLRSANCSYTGMREWRKANGFTRGQMAVYLNVTASSTEAVKALVAGRSAG
jgi:hypothetical protein